MKIGDVKQINGRLMPDGSTQNVNLGIGQLTGQAQTLVCDDGTTRQGLSVRQFLDSQEVVCPAGLVVDPPNGTKPNPNPVGAKYKIGQQGTFGKSYLLDSKFGSPRELDPSLLINPHFGTGIVCGRDKIAINGVLTAGYSFRDNLLHREWFCPAP